ncbi:hypothetical protein KC968_04270 [Candidatus Saccharibacteria bacterium]|nr:hypothetical protein [Candidatus Saccharibacteria bacterium]
MSDSSELMPRQEPAELLVATEDLDHLNSASEHLPELVDFGGRVDISQSLQVDTEAAIATSELVDGAQETQKSRNVRKWIGRSLIGLAIGSGILTVVTDKVDDARDAVVEAAPWVGAGVLASEAMFVGGAAMMAASAGQKIGNPFTIKQRYPEIVVGAGDSKVFRAGLAINTIGAFGDAAVIAAGTFHAMPPETWGIAGIAAIDGLGTLAIRKWMIDKYRYHKDNDNDNIHSAKKAIPEREKRRKTIVRDAEENDLEELVDLDLLMFENAYGSNVPARNEVRDMLSRRLNNIQDAGGRMVVCEVDGVVSAFATYFRTNKPWDQFTTWEDTTNNGTLDGVVDPDGRYAYVVNMTVAPRGSGVRGMQKILANLFAGVMQTEVEYGYFVSRMPQLTQWMSSRGVEFTEATEPELDKLAAEYITTTKPGRKGKQESYDYELRTYDRAGFERGRLVKGGFSDEESLSYGVTYKADIPLHGKPKIIRSMAANLLRIAAKSTKIAGKLF